MSNWRRRHETFPRSERRNGQELFVAAELAHCFSASVAIQEIREYDYQLAPGRYVGTEITTGMSADSVAKLRRELDRLHLRAVEVDAIVGRQLDRIAAWIP